MCKNTLLYCPLFIGGGGQNPKTHQIFALYWEHYTSKLVKWINLKIMKNIPDDIVTVCVIFKWV